MQSKASFSSRFFARTIDLLICLAISIFSVGILAQLIVFAFLPKDFDIYYNFQNTLIEYRLENPHSLSTLEVTQKMIDCSFEDNFVKDQCLLAVDSQTKIHLIGAVISFILCNSYFVLLTISPLQGTPGKRLLGLRVLSDSGKKVNFLQSFTREFFWISQGLIQIFAIFYQTVNYLTLFILGVILFGTVKILFDKDELAIQDNISHTKVVKLIK